MLPLRRHIIATDRVKNVPRVFKAILLNFRNFCCCFVCFENRRVWTSSFLFRRFFSPNGSDVAQLAAKTPLCKCRRKKKKRKGRSYVVSYLLPFIVYEVLIICLRRKKEVFWQPLVFSLTVYFFHLKICILLYIDCFFKISS